MQRAAEEHTGDTALVLVAAGNSTRMGHGERKPFLDLGGMTVLERAAEAFAAEPRVAEIVVVAQEQDHERVRALAREGGPLAKLSAVVAGGAERADSVRRGVEATNPGIALIAVHDAARPLVDLATVVSALAMATARGGALVASRVTDTIKRSLDGQTAKTTLDRSELWAAQTPQVFRRGDLLDWFARAAADHYSPTDDAALCERYRGPVPLVEGPHTNFKLTTLADLDLARAIVARRAGGDGA
ncbi:MAG: 2-C-methyl-D-erythritol 4-phosphate cytidylyltransferase [Planctomycetes bacterium]|nr:2-C-methyl-D-erythritol 4-phosphate cytidylyltransferase [Planctomycetota bacterium]MCB9904458.1 2-C-methyl-D-erythritol 4-phosphate cytidylyltransferase [Planctomycetota bacterium]